jgi:hypothetical protein
VLLATIDDRVRQRRETAENQGVFADGAASGASNGRPEVTATRFEGVDAPSFQRATASARKAVGLRDLAHLHSRRLHGPQTLSAITGESSATAPCRKEIA